MSSRRSTCACRCGTPRGRKDRGACPRSTPAGRNLSYADNSADQVTLFDSDGNARIRLNRSGQTLSYTYDRNDRVLTRAMTGGATATWVYDLLNEVTSLSDAAGNALANTYDLAGRQLTASQTLAGLTGAKVVSYAYDDGAGDKVDRSQTIWPDGYAVTYAYDALGHLTTETDTDGMVLASRTYDNLARPATTQYPNASDNVAYSWDADDDLITLTNHFSNSGANVSFTNAFTPAKQWWTSNISSATYEYAPPTSGTDSYSTANGLNQYGSMTPAGGSAQTISYDTRGNLSGDGTWTFGYDPENRMLSASKTAGGTVSAAYAYDPLGRRTQKSGTGVTTTFFLHDGDSEIAEYDSGGSLVRRYVPGPVIDQPVAMITCITSACTGSNATKTFFHPDKMGSIVAMSDASGTRVEGAYRYDAWGNCIATGGVPCSAGEPYRFTGQRLDPETGLYYYRARYYSSKLGRFLQTDPIGYKNGLNWYLYVWDDPTDLTDPSGMACQTGSRISGNAQGCSSSNGDDEVGSQENNAVNANVARNHPKEYKAMTDTYKKNFGKDFDPHNASAHVSESPNTTCAKSSSCTRSTVFEGLKHCPSPSPCSAAPIENNGLSWAFPVGLVHTELDPENYWLMNITVPYLHLLNPGVVMREAVDRGDSIGVLSISIGTGWLSHWNARYTVSIWTGANHDLQEYLRHGAVDAPILQAMP